LLYQALQDLQERVVNINEAYGMTPAKLYHLADLAYRGGFDVWVAAMTKIVVEDSSFSDMDSLNQQGLAIADVYFQQVTLFWHHAMLNS
jgi:hypothetical protein